MNNAVNKLIGQAGAVIRESIGADGINELIQGPPMALPVEEQPSFGTVAISQVMPDPDQPRKDFGDEDDPEGPIARLAESLKAKGQLQNIRVRWSEQRGKWLIISGERRYRAALRASIPTLNC